MKWGGTIKGTMVKPVVKFGSRGGWRGVGDVAEQQLPFQVADPLTQILAARAALPCHVDPNSSDWGLIFLSYPT